MANTKGSFYTKPVHSRLLARSFCEPGVGKILDLGAGTGSLTSAAATAWPSASITTIDSDPIASGLLLKSMSRIPQVDHRHLLLDLTASHEAGQIPDSWFDVSVCNPPYAEINCERWHEELITEQLNNPLLSSSRKVRMELIFLSLALRATREGGEIGMILPDTFMSGRRFSWFRAEIARRHALRSVIKLPRGAFFKTDAQAHIVVFRKNGEPPPNIMLQQATSAGRLSAPLSISRSDFEISGDYDFQLAQTVLSKSKFITLDQIGADVTRGTLSSSQMRGNSSFVFHTTHFPPKAGGGITLPTRGHSNASPEINAENAFVDRGDIVLARVDRNLHMKIGHIVSGQSHYSDCIFRIRVAPAFRQSVLSRLSSRTGRQMLESCSSGVGARVLAKRVLMTIPLFNEVEAR